MNLDPLPELTPEERARLDEQDRINSLSRVEALDECDRLREQLASLKRISKANVEAGIAATAEVERLRNQLEYVGFRETLLMSLVLSINGLAKIGKMTNDEVLAITNKAFARLDEHKARKATQTDDLGGK